MKITRKELFYKADIVNALLTKEEIESNSQSKLKHAVMRFNKKLAAIVEKNREEANDICINLASPDEKGNLIESGDKRNYSYTKENELKKRKELKALDNKVEDFVPYFFTDKERIATFDLFVQEELSGIFFEPEQAEEKKEESPDDVINP